jgi:hypothetical protein
MGKCIKREDEKLKTKDYGKKEETEDFLSIHPHKTETITNEK